MTGPNPTASPGVHVVTGAGQVLSRGGERA